MIRLLPLYIFFGALGAAALFSGLTGQRVMLISGARWAVVVLTLAGFFMCTFGGIGIFVTKAPTHPLTIVGYILGAVALFAGIVQILRMKVPYLGDPSTALVILTAVIVIKFVIARLAFLLPAR